MSFRGRITTLSALAILLPLLVFAGLLLLTSWRLTDSKTETRLQDSARTTLSLYKIEEKKGKDTLRSILDSKQLQTAAKSSPGSLKDFLKKEAELGNILFAQAENKRGQKVVFLGKRGLIRASSKIAGLNIVLERANPEVLVSDARDLTGQDVALIRSGQVLASTLPEDRPLPTAGTFKEGGRVLSVSEERLGDLSFRIAVPARSSSFLENRLLLFFLLLAILLLAFFISWRVRYSGNKQIEEILKAARGIGRGEFKQKIPQEGPKEMVLLAEELNKMSDNVEELVSSLEEARDSLEKTIQRTGEAFALGPKKQEILQLLLDLSLDASGAKKGIIKENGSKIKQPEGGDFFLLEKYLKETESGTTSQEERGGKYILSMPLISFKNIVGGIALEKNEPFRPEERRTLRYLLSQAQVSLENSELHRRLAEEATQDALTGVSNRRLLQERLSLEIDRAKRFSRPLSIIMLDLDDFKSVNDSYGHDKGDEVLQNVAKTIKDCIRDIDEVSRWGGEEFVVLLTETSKEEAREIAERILKNLTKHEYDNGLRLTASAGVSTYPKAKAGDLIKEADRAMYQAKADGKNCVRLS